MQTSASVLPIRANGERPAFHVVGANAAYGPVDVDRDAVAAAAQLHLGGPEFMGGAEAAKVLAMARDGGALTSADVLAPGDPGLLEWIGPALPRLDYLLPNAEQVLALTAESELGAGCRALLERGAGCVVATCGGDGAVAVDTTGCGDAFSAGFLRGLALGRDRDEAMVLGCATAAVVAGGLGSDHGEFDLAAVDAFAAKTPSV